MLVGSRHTAESLWAAMPLEGLRERTFLGPPGVDVHTFVPRDKAAATSELDALVRWLDSAERTGFGPAAAEAIDALCHPRRDKPPDAEELAAVRAAYDVTGIDVGAPDGLAALDPEREPIVCFVGKLIVSKGVDLLLAAWPRVLAREPRAKLVVVGFGTYREGLEVLLRGLERADERLLMHVCRQGRALEGGPRDQLTYLRTFLEAIAGRHERYFAAAKKMRESIVFTGRLDHGELARLLPSAEEIIVPSMFPEAFGMVAAEGAACGVLPICAAHSGLAEVTAILGEKLPPQVRAAAHLRARHARGRGPRAVDDRLARPRRAAARVGARGAGRHGGGPVRLGVGGRERGRTPRSGRTAVLEPVPGAVPFSRPSAACLMQALWSRLPARGALFTNLASIVTRPEGGAAYAGSGWDVERRADRRAEPHACSEAARLMAERNVGAAIVMDPDSPGPGIVTERDILRSVAAGERPHHRARRRPPHRGADQRRARLEPRAGRGGDARRRLPSPAGRQRRRARGHPRDARHRALLGDSDRVASS